MFFMLNGDDVIDIKHVQAAWGSGYVEMHTCNW